MINKHQTPIAIRKAVVDCAAFGIVCLFLGLFRQPGNPTAWDVLHAFMSCVFWVSVVYLAVLVVLAAAANRRPSR